MSNDFETWKKQQQVEMDALRQNTEMETNNVPSEISNVVDDNVTIPDPDVPIHEETVEVTVAPQTTTIITKTTDEYVIENGKIRGEPQEDHNARVEGIADRAAELMGGEWDREQVIEALQSNSLDKETRIQLESAVSQGMQENGVSTMKYDTQFFNMGELKDQLINNRMTGDFKRELQHYEPSASLEGDFKGFELAGGDGSILHGGEEDVPAQEDNSLSGTENTFSNPKI